MTELKINKLLIGPSLKIGINIIDNLDVVACNRMVSLLS